ncbi:MAG: hypothetical protein ACRD3H_00635 [Terriglobales bacterium]|jgi:hypothetical protein|nr:hypothetical protein [Terriglobales bacterium]
MINPVHHPVTPNQADEVSAQIQQQAAKKTAQKPAVKPPAEDSVTLTRSREASQSGSSR